MDFFQFYYAQSDGTWTMRRARGKKSRAFAEQTGRMYFCLENKHAKNTVQGR